MKKIAQYRPVEQDKLKINEWLLTPLCQSH